MSRVVREADMRATVQKSDRMIVVIVGVDQVPPTPEKEEKEGGFEIYIQLGVLLYQQGG